ncbi:MAG: HIRAN domain-containing protein [Acidimicrobiia bacterium]|nr:HIRAN domain-containing protein [Acidimicrobiia bacterium]MDH5505197.1 HIRAN domain-containing protein [Acidimicrobiia bacterium]
MDTVRDLGSGPSFSPYQPDILVLGGRESLEVVGESRHQDALWHIVGERPGGPDRIRVNVIGVLRPELDNPHDEYAVAVVVTDHRVGHLSREHAALMQHAVIRLEREHGRAIGLHGVIAGGGRRANGPGQLGVFLSFDPADFGLPRSAEPRLTPARRSSVRTGMSVAAATDREDTRYDLSWVDGLAGDSARRIAQLRKLLEAEANPIDRHFMFARLEKDLYYCRDTFESALAEYDEACVAHDAEMGSILPALVDKFGKVPMLETYRQMCIRQQKAGAWEAGLLWAERGIALYGSQAADPDWVADLADRASRFRQKITDGSSEVRGLFTR